MSQLPPLAGPDFSCAACAFDYPSATVADCRELLVALPERVRAAVLAIPDDRLRERPAAGVWSTVEYVCHLRDVYASYTIRLHRTRTEDCPRLEPMLNELRARRFRYNELPVEPVLDQLAANLAGFLDEIDRVRDGDWQRTATRLPREQRDALWLVRQATHEGLHHLADITATVSGMVEEIEHYLIDMDGVLVHEQYALPGANDFIRKLTAAGKGFLVLTNNSIFTPRDLQARLAGSGIEVPADALWTSALATAQFLDSQRPAGSAHAVGEAGLTTALHDAGYVLTDRDPDYVVLGETRTYSFEAITKAIRLIQGGARFIATNPDATGPSPDGVLPATGSVAALITKATGVRPYFVGKPNPLMVRSALNTIGGHSETTAIIGDRMDTDIVVGLEAGLHTILVLSGVTAEHELGGYPYRPNQVVRSVADLDVGVRG